MNTDLISEDVVLDFFESYNETIIVPEPSPLLSIQSLVIYENLRKILLITGKESHIASGFLRKFFVIMDDIDCDIEICDGTPSEPNIDDVKRIKEFIDCSLPDLVIAIGGGSVMDAAKAAYLWSQSGGDIREYFGLNTFSEKNPGKKLKRILCVPTTSGTGSEVTPYSNIVDKEAGVKKLIVDKEIIPSYALLEASLTLTCNREITVNCALDALCHSIEAYLQNSSEDDAIYDKLAFTAIGLICRSLPMVINNPEDLIGRRNLLYAACLGGILISRKPTGIPHLLSYSLYGRIAHGMAVALLLPSAWRFYCEDRNVSEKTLRLNVYFSGKTAEEVIFSYKTFLKNCGICKNISEFVDDRALENAVNLASENKFKLKKLPRKIEDANAKEQLYSIIQNAKAEFKN